MFVEYTLNELDSYYHLMTLCSCELLGELMNKKICRINHTKICSEKKSHNIKSEKINNKLKIKNKIQIKIKLKMCWIFHS